MIMAVSYGCLYTGYYFLEKEHISKDEGMEVERKELLGAVSIALGAFLMSNISFVMPNTPFSSATSSLLYVRTLVDFGGLLMLFATAEQEKGAAGPGGKPCHERGLAAPVRPVPHGPLITWNC